MCRQVYNIGEGGEGVCVCVVRRVGTSRRMRARLAREVNRSMHPHTQLGNWDGWLKTSFTLKNGELYNIHS